MRSSCSRSYCHDLARHRGRKTERASCVYCKPKSCLSLLRVVSDWLFYGSSLRYLTSATCCFYRKISEGHYRVSNPQLTLMTLANYRSSQLTLARKGERCQSLCETSFTITIQSLYILSFEYRFLIRYQACCS